VIFPFQDTTSLGVLIFQKACKMGTHKKFALPIGPKHPSASSKEGVQNHENLII